MRGISHGRLAAGVAALLAFVLMAIFLPRTSGLRQRAVVEAGRTFSFRSLDNGRYSTNLQDGLPARGQGMINQQILQFQRSELLEMKLTAGLENGSRVAAGDVLATINSPRLDRQFAEMEANRASLEATRGLLVAGGHPADVQEASRELELVQVARDGTRAQLDRLQALAGEELISVAEVEAARLKNDLMELEVELARSRLDVARGLVRPEELRALDAEILALDTRLAEVHELLARGQIKSPIGGILEVGGRRTLLRVYDIETVYLRIPIPEADRYRVEMGDAVEFHTPSLTGRTFIGDIIDLGENATSLNGLQIFWASAAVQNGDGSLRSGMTGVVDIALSGGRRSMIGTLLREFLGG